MANKFKFKSGDMVRALKDAKVENQYYFDYESVVNGTEVYDPLKKWVLINITHFARDIYLVTEANRAYFNNPDITDNYDFVINADSVDTSNPQTVF